MGSSGCITVMRIWGEIELNSHKHNYNMICFYFFMQHIYIFIILECDLGMFS